MQLSTFDDDAFELFFELKPFVRVTHLVEVLAYEIGSTFSVSPLAEIVVLGAMRFLYLVAAILFLLPIRYILFDEFDDELGVTEIGPTVFFVP
jgi:hypothetical protein